MAKKRRSRKKSAKQAARKRGDISRKVKIPAYWRKPRGPNKGKKKVATRTVPSRKRYRVARHNRRAPRR